MLASSRHTATTKRNTQVKSRHLECDGPDLTGLNTTGVWTVQSNVHAPVFNVQWEAVRIVWVKRHCPLSWYAESGQVHRGYSHNAPS